MINKEKVKWIVLAAIFSLGLNASAQDSFCKEYLSMAPAGPLGAAYDLDKSGDNRLLLTGRTSNAVGPMDDFYVAKVNPINGNLLGFSQFGSEFDDRAMSSAPTADGGVIAVGYAWQQMSEWDRIRLGFPLNTGNSTFSMVKLNADGTIGWERHLDIGAYDDMAFSIMEKSDGTFLVLGRTHLTDGNKYLALVNVDAAGNLLSVATYDQIFMSGEELFGVDIIEAQDGSFFILAVDGYGSANRNDPFETKGLAEEMYLIRLNADLSYNSGKKIDLARPDFNTNRLMAYDLEQADNGDLAIIGYIRSEDAGVVGTLQFDGFIIEFDNLMNFNNSHYFDFSDTDRAIPMDLHTFAGGYVIGGTTWTQSFVHVVDNFLSVTGTSVFDGTSSNETYSIFQEGNFFFFGGEVSQITLLKKKGANLNCCEIPSSVRALEGIFVNTEDIPIGFNRVIRPYDLQDNLTLFDFDETVVTNCPTMAPLSVSELEQSNELFEVYPNPASGELNVSVDNYAAGDRLELYSTDGQLMMEVTVTQTVSTLDISNLSPGIYVMVLNHEQEMYRKKVVVN